MENVRKDIVVILDNGHGRDTIGKCSPDKRLMEYQYTREIVAGIVAELTKLGIECRRLVPEFKDIPLSTRTKRANNIYTETGKKAILISVHCNAAGADGKWYNARGFSVFVAQNASSNSKRLAKDIYEAAEKLNLKGNRSVPKEKYWVQNLAICRDTNCPAVLTENLFQDNKEDVDFLLTDAGRKAIIDAHVNGILTYLSNG